MTGKVFSETIFKIDNLLCPNSVITAKNRRNVLLYRMPPDGYAEYDEIISEILYISVNRRTLMGSK